MDFNFKPVGQFLAALTVTCGMVIAATDAQSLGGAAKSARAPGAPVTVEVAVASADATQMSDAGESGTSSAGRAAGAR